MAAVPQFDVAHQVSLATGLDNGVAIAAHQGRTLAGAISHQLFRNSFQAFRDKDIDEVKSDLKILYNLNVAEGRIRLLPAATSGLTALVRWVQDEYRYARDPALTAYPIAEEGAILHRAAEMDHFLGEAKSKTTSWTKFKPNDDWTMWKATFEINATETPGRLGIPLLRVIRDNDDPDPTPRATVMATYAYSTPLAGEDYVVDNAALYDRLAEVFSENFADTIVMGPNFVMEGYSYRSAEVYAYDKRYDPVVIPIGSGATAYDCPKLRRTILLIINEGLCYGTKMDHSLWNPNQLRHYGVTVQDNPYSSEPLGITADGYFFPMECKGTKIQFPTRCPTAHELATCERVTLTSYDEWNPSEVVLGEVGTAPSDQPVAVESDYGDEPSDVPFHVYSDPTSDEALLHEISSSLTPSRESIISKVNLPYDRYSFIGAVNLEQPSEDFIPARRSYVSHERHSKVSAETLSERFLIGLPRARATLKATTQHGVRSAILPLARRYRDDRRFSQRRLMAKFATDTLYAPTKSLEGHKAAQIYSHKAGFTTTYDLIKVDGPSIGQTLNDFINDWGIPDKLTFDGAMAQKGHDTLFMKIVRKANIDYHISEPRRPNQNPSEAAIREVKKRLYRLMIKKRVPRRLWNFALRWICETGNVTVTSSHYAQGRTPLEIVTGETPDISEYFDFGFYDWVTFKSNGGVGGEEIGRWLGVSHRVGPLMSYWILPKSGIPISCTTVQRMPVDMFSKDETQKAIADYEKGLEKRLEAASADLSKHPQPENMPQSHIMSLDDEDPDFLEEFMRIRNNEDVPYGEDDDIEVTEDPYLQMEFSLPRGEDGAPVHYAVKQRVIDGDGKPKGVRTNNYMTDTAEYVVADLDGNEEIVTANVIAENLLAQTDDEGHRHMLLDEILDLQSDKDAVPKERGLRSNKFGVKTRVRTLKGWKVLVRWKGGMTEWIELKDMKDSYPVDMAEFAVTHEVQDEPAFAWWVPYTMKKRNRIISKVKSKYWQRTHKYGIRIPKSVKEAFEIDKANGNTYWEDAIKKEMANVGIAFSPSEEENPHELEKLGYQLVNCHMIFDVKLGENFRRKARYVAGGHMTDTPASMTYSSVVSRDSVRICLTLAALNGLKVLSGDIQNAYLTAPNKEKIFMRAGPEFGSNEGKLYIVERALYGLKSAGASFRSYLAGKIHDLGFRPSPADPDVWLRAATKADGTKYYEYVLVYVDDILAISEKPEDIMNSLMCDFTFKGGKDAIEPPTDYLGAKLEWKDDIMGHGCWSMTSVKYVNAAIDTVEQRLKERNDRPLPSRAATPMSYDYIPELDATEELESEEITYYQELIGILRWATELGRVDILHEVSILSEYQASPRRGHMNALLHILGYLKANPKRTLCFLPARPNISDDGFDYNAAKEFKEFYVDAEEEIPTDAPEPRGEEVLMTAYVDASHASNKKTRRSHTGYLIFINCAPIIWYSKRQRTVESSTFGSEYIATKTCVEAVQALRFKLRMFGVPIDGPCRMFNDNESVVKNSSKVESTLTKKHNQLAYHVTRWAVAAGSVIVAWIPTNRMLADPLTKRMPSKQSRDELFFQWMY